MDIIHEKNIVFISVIFMDIFIQSDEGIRWKMVKKEDG